MSPLRQPQKHGLTLLRLRAQVAPDEEYDWALRYQGRLRALPLATGALGITAVLVNRLASGVRR